MTRRKRKKAKKTPYWSNGICRKCGTFVCWARKPSSEHPQAFERSYLGKWTHLEGNVTETRTVDLNEHTQYLAIHVCI